MHLIDGRLVKGSPPKNVGQQRGSTKPSSGPKIITHRPQMSAPGSSVGNLDALLRGQGIKLCVYRNLGGLGDIIMATPIARGAKKKYPNCHVTFAVDTQYAGGDLAALLLHNPYIDEIVDYKIVVRDDYHAFTDITRAGLRYERPDQTFANRIDLFARSARVPLFGETLPIYVMTEEEVRFGQEWAKKNLPRPDTVKGFIALHNRSNESRRSWVQDRIREFVHLAKDAGYHTIIFGWNDDPEQWRLAGSTLAFNFAIRQAAAIMNQCDVVVCPDSALLHLAGAMNMRIVALFGSMPPACRINHYPNAIAVVNQQLGCIGCVYTYPCGCPGGEVPYCMRSIQASTVLAAVEKKMNEPLVQVGNIRSEAITQDAGPFSKEISTIEL